jgi:hypothetical protein
VNHSIATIDRKRQAPTPNSWVLPHRALSVFYGCSEMPRLSHYFLPQILARQGRVLYLDGANQIDPLLISRLARERGEEPAAFHRLIRVARAFTCFQLTELVGRARKFLKDFPAGIVMVSALPDLFFDEDVKEREARASFERALKELQTLVGEPLGVAVFSDATSFQTPRKDFFRQLKNQADHVLRVEAGPDSRLTFKPEKTTQLLPV